MNRDDYDRAFRLLTGCVNAKDYEQQKDRIWNPEPKQNPARKRCGRPAFDIPKHMRETYLSTKHAHRIVGEGEL